MNRACKFLVAGIVVIGSAGVSSAAWGYFTTSGSGVGAGSIGTLAPPTNVLAPSPAPGVTTVAVSWTPPISPDGTALKGFYVERLTGASASAACDSTPSPPPLAGTANSCNDTGLAAGTYTYRVTAYWRSWTATSAPSSATTVSPADGTPPSVAVTFPASNGSYTTSSFNGGCSPVGICGTASDLGSGVASVSVSIKSGLNYWTGSAFNTTTPTFVPVTTGTTTWKYTFATPASGTYVVQARATDNASNIGTSVTNTFVIDNTPPTVTINQAAGQTDPTSGSTVHFTAVFSESVTGFDSSDVSRGGAVGGGIVVGGGGTTYDIAIGPLTATGAFTATIPAGGALDAAGNLNPVSTSTDNSVTRDTTGPTVTINQAAAQADPTNGTPINFTAAFSAAVSGFTSSDIALSGTAGATTATVSGSGPTYNVAVSGMTTGGTVIATIPADAALSITGSHPNAASTSTDNTVTRDTTGPTVTINQAAAQADPTNGTPINFTAVFSQPVTGASFTGADITLSGSAGATAATVTGGPTTWNVAVSGMTADGTIIATIPADAALSTTGSHPTAASTSTDTTVTRDTTAPVVTVTSLSDGGGSSKVTVAGSGGSLASDGTVTVYLCRTTPCSSANFQDSKGGLAVDGAGHWSYGSGNIGIGTYYATAVQTDDAGNAGTFSNFGPFTR